MNPRSLFSSALSPVILASLACNGSPSGERGRKASAALTETGGAIITAVTRGDYETPIYNGQDVIIWGSRLGDQVWVTPPLPCRSGYVPLEFFSSEQINFDLGQLDCTSLGTWHVSTNGATATFDAALAPTPRLDAAVNTVDWTTSIHTGDAIALFGHDLSSQYGAPYTVVFLAGIPLSPTYTSPDQINVAIPGTLAPGSYQIFVDFYGALATPIPIMISE